LGAHELAALAAHCSQDEDKPEQLMCKPFLPRLTSVFVVAAQPAIASTTINIKIRFIPVLITAADLMSACDCVRFCFKRS
jgi:hypothetical protein